MPDEYRTVYVEIHLVPTDLIIIASVAGKNPEDLTDFDLSEWVRDTVDVELESFIVDQEVTD